LKSGKTGRRNRTFANGFYHEKNIESVDYGQISGIATGEHIEKKQWPGLKPRIRRNRLR
jgi:hypothetical protein